MKSPWGVLEQRTTRSFETKGILTFLSPQDDCSNKEEHEKAVVGKELLTGSCSQREGKYYFGTIKRETILALKILFVLSRSSLQE